jgi:ABC-2 type transport system permease protein
LLPLTWFLEILRGILLKGIGIEDLWKQLAILTVSAVALLAISVRRFSKTLD